MPLRALRKKVRRTPLILNRFSVRERHFGELAANARSWSHRALTRIAAASKDS